MNSSNYLKIAIFFSVLLSAGAGYVILSANGISAFNTKTYETILNDASGLSTRSKIYLAGVPVGKVQGIDLNGTEARIRLAVFKDVEVRQDAVISRKASSLLGTSVLSLDPGTERAPIVPSGSFINTAPPAGDMNTALNAVQDLGGQIGGILEEFRSTQMALLTISLETINSIAKKFDAQSDAQLRNISRILESTMLITERTERMLRSSEGNITGSFLELHEALANLRSISGEIAMGRGNLGQAVYDDRLYSSILSTAEKTEDAAGKLGETLGNISSLAKNADGVITSAGEIVNKALGLGIQVDTNARFDVVSQTARAGASIRLDPGPNGWYRIGVSSSPEGVANRTVKETLDTQGNRVSWEDTTETKYTISVDAELARRFGAFTIRGGLLESTAGFGMDLQPLKWASLSGELFNFTAGNVPNLRSTITLYPFFDPDSDKPWNWIYLRGGINNALSLERDFFFGAGFRFADRDIKGLIGLIPALN